MSFLASRSGVYDVDISKVPRVRGQALLDRFSAGIAIGIDLAGASPRRLARFDAVRSRPRTRQRSAATLRVNTCPAASVSSRIN